MRFSLAFLLLIGAAAQDPAVDPLEDNVTFRLTFEDTLKPEKSAAAEAGPRVAFMSTADRKDWFQVDKDRLDPKHYVPGLRGKGLTNADPRTFFPEIQYPIEGHLKAKSGTVLWWMKFSKPASEGGGGGAMFATHGGSLFCALEASPTRDERGVLVVAQDQRETPVLGLAQARGKIAAKEGQWTQVGVRWDKKTVSLLLNGQEASSETLRRAFTADQFTDYFVVALFSWIKEGDVAVLDEFTIYNRPLTSEEIRTEYDRLVPRRK